MHFTLDIPPLKSFWASQLFAEGERRLTGEFEEKDASEGKQEVDGEEK